MEPTLIREIERFEYPLRAFANRRSYVRLRLLSYQGKTLALCIEPHGKEEMSVTNSIEEIRAELVRVYNISQDDLFIFEQYEGRPEIDYVRFKDNGQPQWRPFQWEELSVVIADKTADTKWLSL